MHGGAFARSGEILLDRGDKIAWLLAAQARRAGGRAVAVFAVTPCAGLRQRLSVLIGREDFGMRSGGARNRRQAGVVCSHVLFVCLAHVLGHARQGGVAAMAFLVLVQRGNQITLALPRQVGNSRGKALAVHAMAPFALLLGQSLARSNIRCERRMVVPTGKLARATVERRAQDVP